MRKFINTVMVAVLCVFANSCLNDSENQNWTQTILLEVSSGTAVYYPAEGAGAGFDGISIKEDNEDYWKTLPLNGIDGFHYTAGYEYKLKILKTHLANPPADGSSVTYKLLEIVEKTPIINK